MRSAPRSARRSSCWTPGPTVRRSTSTAPTRRRSCHLDGRARSQPADVPLNLQPEDIENYEAGLKGSLLGGRLSLEASYFNMTDDGVVLSQRQGAVLQAHQRRRAEVQGRRDRLRLVAAAQVSTYVNASFYRNRFGEFVIQSAGGNTRADRQPPRARAGLHRELGRERRAHSVHRPDIGRQAHRPDVW